MPYYLRSRRPKGKEVVETLDWANGLPNDVAVAIMQRVGTMDLLESVQRACSSWYKICKDPALWRFIDTHKTGDLCEYAKNLRKLYKKMESIDYDQAIHDFTQRTRNAIDRSCGQLISINLEYFGTNSLLVYIANKEHQLRSLQLVMCHSINDDGMIEAAKKMPSLEELHIYFGNITYEGLEQVGLSCPGLKSLTYNQQGIMDDFPSDSEEIEFGDKLDNLAAYAISRTMPELRNLSLFGRTLTNRALKAILDGCPHLESVDIRQCFNVDLSDDEELDSRCNSIKVFRKTNDCFNDYQWDPKCICYSDNEVDDDDDSDSESDDDDDSESDDDDDDDSESESDDDSGC